MTIPAVRAAVDKVWNKLNKLPAWDHAEVEAKADVVGEARSRQVLVLFASLMDFCRNIPSWLSTCHNMRDGWCFVENGTDDFGFQAVFFVRGSLASQVDAGTITDTSFQTAKHGKSR